jgi:hypothetical protein
METIRNGLVSNRKYAYKQSRKFFDKDHSTVIHALKVVRLANNGFDYLLKEKIDKIMNCIDLSIPYSHDSSENEKNSLIYLERLIKKKLAAEGML